VKRLIVTADDVGLHRGMTEGAIRAHQMGIVTACSISANGIAFDDAVSRLRDVPSLEVGVHLTLVEERALTTGEPMPKNYIRFVLARPRGIERELRAQIDRVLGSGLRVTHLNGHQHLHQLPRVYEIVERLASEYGIGYVRRVRDRGGNAGLLRRASVAILNSLGRGTNDSTIGVLEAGHLRDIARLLPFVEGTTELVTHPGVNVGAYPHWRYDWDAETAALCDPSLRDAIARAGIELITPSVAVSVH
jgi:chitin disaccharide deacetylase